MEYSESLKKNRDFKTVYGNGKSRANKYLVMYVMKNGTEKNRIGISVSKKLGNSVVRHHLTRLIREMNIILKRDWISYLLSESMQRRLIITHWRRH